jgi:hypothetical protein
MKIGCVDAKSVVEMGNTVVWWSQTKQGRKQVMVLNGTQPEPISTPYVEKDINGWGAGLTAPAFGLSLNGHAWYVMNVSGNIAWVYDFLTKRWCQWTITGNGGMPFIGLSNAGGFAQPKMLQGSTAQLLILNDNAATDYAGTFAVRSTSPKVDMGNNKLKFWGPLQVICDRPGASITPTIYFSDDDYQTTVSPSRTVDLNTSRPILYQNGAARRRSITFDLTDSTSTSRTLRIEGYELEYEQGT